MGYKWQREDDGSKEDDEPKRQREESSNISCLDSPMLPGNMFAESLKSNECLETWWTVWRTWKKSKGFSFMQQSQTS